MTCSCDVAATDLTVGAAASAVAPDAEDGSGTVAAPVVVNGDDEGLNDYTHYYDETEGDRCHRTQPK